MYILAIDRDSDFLKSIQRVARDYQYDIECYEWTSQNQTHLQAHIERLNPDVIVVNLDLDDPLNFGDIVQQVFNASPGQRPLVAGLSKKNELHFKKQAFEMGLDDYILQPVSPLEIWFRIAVLTRLKSVQTQLNNANKRLSVVNQELSESNLRLQEATLTDDLTGLSNMRFMTQYLEQQFTLLKRHPRPFAVLMMDLDHFKIVNDTNDHLIGSNTIQKVGEIITEVMRNTDVKARYGGDEYIMVMPETDTEGVIRAAERLLQAIRQHTFKGNRGNFKITTSLGLAVYDPNRHHKFTELIKEADLALFQSKESGRNRWTLYDSQNVKPQCYDEKQSSVLSSLKKVS